MLRARLVAFYDKRGVIIPGQYGFRAGHSTTMVILDMVEMVKGACGKGNAALGVFLPSHVGLFAFTTSGSLFSV